MICKNCYAVLGNVHPKSPNIDWRSCKCGLGYATSHDHTGMMIPVYKCTKVKSWAELKRVKQEKGMINEKVCKTNP